MTPYPRGLWEQIRGLLFGSTLASDDVAHALRLVVELHGPREGWSRDWIDPAEAMNHGWPMCAGCDMPGIGQRDIAHCPTIRAAGIGLGLVTS